MLRIRRALESASEDSSDPNARALTPSRAELPPGTERPATDAAPSYRDAPWRNSERGRTKAPSPTPEADKEESPDASSDTGAIPKRRYPLTPLFLLYFINNTDLLSIIWFSRKVWRVLNALLLIVFPVIFEWLVSR